MSEQIQVSVVVPAYNCAALLPNAIESCLRQSERSFWELLVIDDGSTDDTYAVAASYLTDPRVRLLPQPNQGVGAARNLGIANARGQFIALLDADDYYQDDTLKAFVGLSRRLPESAALVYCNYIRTELGSHRKRPVRVRPPAKRPLLYQQLLLPRALPILTSTTLIRKSALKAVGSFNPEFEHCEDLELWMRLVVDFDFAKAKIFSTFRGVHAAQATSNRPEILKWRERCNLAFLNSHDLGFFAGTDDERSQARLAEGFGDAMLASHEPLPRVALYCYERALLANHSDSLAAKLEALRARIRP